MYVCACKFTPPGSLSLSLSQVFGLESILGNSTMWPVLMGLTVIPSALQILLLHFCPESPRYLYIIRNKESKAKESEPHCPCPVFEFHLVSSMPMSLGSAQPPCPKLSDLAMIPGQSGAILSGVSHISMRKGRVGPALPERAWITFSAHAARLSSVMVGRGQVGM